jgi:hypothetical protein
VLALFREERTALGHSPDGSKVRSDRVDHRLEQVGIENRDVRKPQGTPELIKKDLGAVTSMGITRQGSLYYALSTSTRDVYTAEINPETGAMITP